MSTQSKVERIKLISFMTRGEFEIGSSEMKKEPWSHPRGLCSPLPRLPLPAHQGFGKLIGMGVPSILRGSSLLPCQRHNFQTLFVRKTTGQSRLGRVPEIDFSDFVERAVRV